ncbi:MAG: hypothetical protein OXG35_32310 [Acidobacteria bacterium]|nr:hypothetical protein [Acidobacteriota bacterium]
MNQVVNAVDLVVLVADKDLEEAVQALLVRTGDLKLRPFRFEVRRHPNRDGGCRTGAANFLRPFLQRYRRSLVLFDRDGCGSSRSRTEIQREVDADLARNGWASRTKAIVIEPELEAWVWGDLAQASRTLGWGEDAAGLRRCLRSRDLWEPRRPKPSDPKKAMRAAMECAPPGRRRKRSARVFREIAGSTPVESCRDPAFSDLRSVLQAWFPAKRT